MNNLLQMATRLMASRPQGPPPREGQGIYSYRKSFAEKAQLG
jgi:hypothetical protein